MDFDGAEPEIILRAIKKNKNIEYLSLDFRKERKGKLSSQSERENTLNRINFQKISSKNERFNLIYRTKNFI